MDCTPINAVDDQLYVEAATCTLDIASGRSDKKYGVVEVWMYACDATDAREILKVPLLPSHRVNITIKHQAHPTTSPNTL